MKGGRREVAEALARVFVQAVPPGWSLSHLGEVAELQPGYAFDSDWFSTAGVRLLRGTNIVPGGTRWDDVVCLPLDRVDQFVPFRLNVGDIVIAMDRPFISTGLKIARLAAPDCPALLLQRVGRFHPTAAISADYLYYYLNASTFGTHVGGLATGTQLPHISKTDIETCPILLPPVNEQRRIVAKLDAIFEQIRAAKTRLEHLPALLEKLKRSILAAAFRGDLTADWRAAHPDVEPASALLDRIRTERRSRWEADLRAKGKDPARAAYGEPALVDATPLADLPLGWEWASVDDVSELQLGQQRAPVHADAKETYPYIRAANIKWSGLDLSDVKRMGFPDPQRYLLRTGDVLLSEASGSPTEVGKSAIWRDEIPGCCYQKTLLRARPRSPEVSSEWLHASFVADALLGRFARMAPGVGILHLTADRMLPWPVPLAPAIEQSVIIQRLQLALGTIARLERVLAESLRSVERCEQAALARAFRGELVPQDPHDEPAAVLLERIRAARSNISGSRP